MDDGVRITANKNRLAQQVRVAPSEWTRERREAFLGELANSCNVRRAHDVAGMERTSAYRLRRTDPTFAALWQEALAIGYDRLETALLHQALIGVNAIDVATAADDRAAAAAHWLDGQDAAPAAPARVDMMKLAITLLDRAARSRGGVAIHGKSQGSEADTDAALRRALDKLARIRAARPA